MKSKIIPFVLIIIGFLAGATALSAIASTWTAPTQAPPGCPTGSPGCDAPVNVSTSAQVKLGPLTLNSNLANEIGLIIGNKIKIVDGNQAAGKVLVSDANGVGSWQSKGLVTCPDDSKILVRGGLMGCSYTVDAAVNTDTNYKQNPTLFSGGAYYAVCFDSADQIISARDTGNGSNHAAQLVTINYSALPSSITVTGTGPIIYPAWSKNTNYSLNACKAWEGGSNDGYQSCQIECFRPI